MVSIAKKQLCKCWNKESMVAAMKAVETKKMSITAAAFKWGPNETWYEAKTEHHSFTLTFEKENALRFYPVYMENCEGLYMAITKHSGNDSHFIREYDDERKDKL